MDFFQLLWLRSTSLYPRHLQEGNKNFYLQNWLSLVLTSRTASEALEAVLVDFFQFFVLRPTSLCPKHLPEVKENFYLQNWLSLVLTSRTASEALKAEGFDWFWPKIIVIYLKNLLELKYVKKKLRWFSLAIVGYRWQFI